MGPNGFSFWASQLNFVLSGSVILTWTRGGLGHEVVQVDQVRVGTEEICRRLGFCRLAGHEVQRLVHAAHVERVVRGRAAAACKHKGTCLLFQPTFKCNRMREVETPVQSRGILHRLTTTMTNDCHHCLQIRSSAQITMGAMSFVRDVTESPLPWKASNIRGLPAVSND